MMWGDRSPRAKLTGDSRRGFEAVLIGDCRSFRSLARNWPLRLLRLLQQYLPFAEVASLFDHLVGASLQRGGNDETQCLSGLEVDPKPVGRGLLKWQIARFLAAQITVDVIRN
jgi:hypothetical protein